MEHVRPATATFEHLPARGSPSPGRREGVGDKFLAASRQCEGIYEEVSNDPIA